MVPAKSRSTRKSQPGRPPPSDVDSGATTTTDNETTDPSQITIQSSTVTPSSSSGSLAMNQMPSVIDLTANSQKPDTENDLRQMVEKLTNTQYRDEGILTLLQPPGKENLHSPQQTDDATQKSSTEPPATELPATEAQNTVLTQAPSKLKSRFQGRYESSVFCRICHEIGSTDIFISPCDCKGSLSLVHKHCLERWLAESNSSLCELCGYEYNTMRLPKHNAVGSVFAWLLASGNSRERRLLAWDLFSFIILLPLAAMGTSLGMKVLAKDVVGSMNGVILVYTRFLQLAMITATITLDAGILTWALIRIQYHFLHWYNWYKRNCKVILLGYPEPQTAPAVQHTSSATVREMQF